MDISFASSKLKRQCTEERLLVRTHGTQRAKLIRRRLDDVAAVETLADLKHLPGRWHELQENRKGQLSVDLDGPYRLILTPEGEGKYKPDGGLDWTLVRAVCVHGVEDTHE